MMPSVGITQTHIKQWQIDHDKHDNHDNHDNKQETTVQPQQRRRRRRLSAHENEKNVEESEHEEVSKESNDQTSNDDKELKEKIQSEIDQTINMNAKTNKLEIYVVHNDPDDKTAYSIKLHSNKNDIGTFTKKWKLYKDYCSKGGAAGYDTKGNCDGLDIEDNMEELEKNIIKEQKCKHIVLCKNGAFRFDLSKDLIIDRNINDLYVSTALVSSFSHIKSTIAQYKNTVHIIVKEDGDFSSCPFPSINLKFKCYRHLLSRKDIFSNIQFKQAIWFGDKSYIIYVYSNLM